MKLNPSQEVILKAYAKECHPKITKNPEDWAFLIENRFIHKEQDHITDKGCAYVVSELDIPYSKFISWHKWKGRHAVLIEVAKRVFKSQEELDIYFKEKYKINLKYDTFGPSGQEYQADPLTLKKIGAEMCLALLANPKIEWKKVRGWLASKDATGTLEQIQSKEFLGKVLEEQLAKYA